MASVKEYVQGIVNAIGEVNSNAGVSAINPLTNYNKINFNIDLSTEEVIKILKELTYYDLSSFDISYMNNVVYASNDLSNGLLITKIPQIEGVYLIYMVLNGEQVYIFDSVGISTEFTKSGWLITESEVECNFINGILGFDGINIIGQENDLLKNLIYVNSNTINAQDVPNKIRELKVEIGNGEVFPTASYDKIYFNKSLSKDEVFNILNSIEYTELGEVDGNPLYIYAVYATNGSLDVENTIVILKQIDDEDASNITFMIMSNGVTYNSSVSNPWGSSNDYSEFSNVNGDSSINGGGITINVGTQNHKLSKLISPFQNFSGKQLLGTYDGSSVEVTEEGIVDIGAMLDKGKLPLEVNVKTSSISITSEVVNPLDTYQTLYVNTNLTNDDLLALVSKLPKRDYGNVNSTYDLPSYLLFYSEPVDNWYYFVGINYDTSSGNVFIIAGSQTTSSASTAYLYRTDDGWLTSKLENGIYNFGPEVVGVSTLNSLPVGDQNELVKNIISSSPFGECTELIVVDKKIYGKDLDKVTINEFSYNITIDMQNFIDDRKNANYLFYGCGDVVINKYVGLLNYYNVTSTHSMFRDSKVKTLPHLNMRNTNNGAYMFSGNTLIKEIDIEFTTSDVGSMSTIVCMFKDCSALEIIHQPMNIKNVSSAQNGNAFYGCKNIKSFTLLSIRDSITIGFGDGTGTNDYGTKITLDTLINTTKELINTGSALTLTMGTANLEKIANTYVKFTDSTQTTIESGTKGDVVVCESTDTGAMLLSDYALLKNWTLA